MKRSIGLFGHIGTEERETSMTHSRGFGLPTLLGIAGILVGCGGDPGQHSSSSTDIDAGESLGRDGGVNAVPPKPISDRPPCILSADCPAGLHCDLGECIQDCNTDSACSDDKTCSSRARCLTDSQADEDPLPPSTSAGTLDVTPLSVKLTRSNNGKTFNLTMSTNTTDDVRYRVQVNAPYLSVGKARGTFKSQTTLPIKVDTSNIVARDIPGSVTIYSTLGETDIPMPLHVGLTGRYHGSLRYNGDAIPLGDTRFDLDIIENNGDVSVRVAPEHSMLFPQGATSDDVAYGFGSLNTDGSVDLTIEHRIEATAGGNQNHLGRPIGRRLIVHLALTDTGLFDGNFAESIYGLFQNPVQTKGTAHLQIVPEAGDPDFQTKNVIMPTIDATTQNLPMTTTSVFNGGPYACPMVAMSASAILSTCYNPLRAAIQNVSTQYSVLSESCKGALGLPNTAGGSTDCGCVTYAACAMRANAAGGGYATAGADQGALAQNLVAPAALVAQQEVVAALRDSVKDGAQISTELAHYDTALAALAPAAKWLMQPGMLEFFRNIPATVAQQPPALPALNGAAAQGTEAEQFPIARALAKVVQLLVDVNSERQRVAAVTTNVDPSTQIAQAQNNSTITYLEAVALLGVLDSWAIAPPSAAASVTGVLTKLDHAFTDMTQDAGCNLGTPKRHVPFVYRADDTSSGATNFEQKLTIAGKAVTALQSLETTFTTEAQQVDQAQYANATQMTSAQTTLDQQIHDICGADFNLDPPTGALDWTKCGATGGTMAEFNYEIQSAQNAAEASAQRAQGQKDKIDVDVHLVATKKNMRDDELSFIDSSNDQINANAETIGMINAIQDMMHMASNSSLFNAGAPAVMAVADYGLGLEKAGLEEDNKELLQEQDMKVKQTDADIEYADGMANIKREQIDLAEMVIEARQTVIGILEAKVKMANALSKAQELYASRTQTKQLITSDPSMDPAYRLVRNKTALNLLDARDSAQQQLLAAGRALEYEMDYDLPTLEVAVQSARNHAALSMLQTCLDGLFDQFNELYSSPQPASTQVSVRKLFGITGPRQDEVTGATLSEGQQFRAYVLNNQSLDANGSLRIQFSTNLMPGNGLWSTATCIDKISDVQAQLVGDFLGDNDAEIRLALSGMSVLRSCDTNELRDWNLDTDGVAVIQAGVNTFGTETNTSLFGQSVARATWTIDILGGNQSAANMDVDVTKLDDIVLKISHKAVPIQSSRISSLDDSCLTNIING